MKRIHWLMLSAAAVGALMFSLWAERGDGPRVRPAAAAEEQAAPEARREAPSLQEVLAQQPARQNRERHDAPVVNGVVQIGPIARGPGAPPPPAAAGQTSSAWATSYAIAMCDCHTRACANELQGRFIQSMGGVEHDQARDAVTYQDSMKRAVDCYLALPEGT